MEKPFKFRRAREIAGAFVLLGIVLLIAGIVVQGQVKGWFQPKTEFEVVLPPDGTQGIARGSEVHILGSKVGTVQGIEMRRKGSRAKLSDFTQIPADEIELVAVLQVRGGLAVFVGKDSEAVLKKDLAGFGSSYFELTRAGGTWPENAEQRQLPFREMKDVQNELTAIVKEIRDSLIPALEKIQFASNEIGILAKNLSGEESNFQQSVTKLRDSLTGLDAMIATMNSGEGAIGAMLKDKTTESDFRESISNFKKASGELNSSLAKVDTIVEGVERGEGAAGLLLRDAGTANEIDRAVGNIDIASSSMRDALANFDRTSEQFPEVISQWNEAVGGFGEAAKIMQEALAEYELLARGLQEHPLLRGSVNRAREQEGIENAAKAGENGESVRAASSGERESGNESIFKRTKSQPKTFYRSGEKPQLRAEPIQIEEEPAKPQGGLIQRILQKNKP